MVILYHYTFRLHARDDLSPVGYPAAIEGVTRYGFLGVQLFFLISGAVILRSTSGRTARSFLKSRSTRLLPAYWVMVTITFTACSLWGFGVIASPSTKNYLGNLTMLQTFYGGNLIDGVYWTLARELVFYAIVFAILVSYQIKNIHLIFAGWLVVSVAAEVFHHPFDTHVLLATDYAAFFVGGSTCALLAQEYTSRKRGFLWILLFASMATAVWSTAGREARRINNTFGAGTVNGSVMAIVIVVFFVIVYLTCTGRWSKFGRPWMLVAGALTYPLYLIHQNVGAIMFTRFASWNRWVLLIFITTSMVVLSWCVHRFVERPTSRRLLHRSAKSTASSSGPDKLRS